MLRKCANESCFAPFRYLGEGRLFQLESDGLAPAAKKSGVKKTEYFWLCSQCSNTMVLTVSKDGKVAAVPAASDDTLALSGPVVRIQSLALRPMRLEE